MSQSFAQSMIDLIATLSTQVAGRRSVTRTLKDREQYRDGDLESGVFTVLSAGCVNFQNTPGRTAAFGRHRVLITGQIKVPHTSDGAALEDAEFGLIDDLISMAQGPLPESIGGLAMIEFAQSAQAEHPYGWIAAVFEIGP